MILNRLRNVIRELTKAPIDRPRDEFRFTFRGGLFRPVLRCTVCDTRSNITKSQDVGDGWRVEYRCPSCGTKGKYQTTDHHTRVENLYPEEWEGNPYDTYPDQESR